MFKRVLLTCFGNKLGTNATRFFKSRKLTFSNRVVRGSSILHADMTVGMNQCISMVILRGQIACQKLFLCLVYMYMYTDHRKINTRQQTLDYSFETHRNVIRKDGHLPFIRMTQQRDMQHKALYARNLCGKLNMTLRDAPNSLG